MTTYDNRGTMAHLAQQDDGARVGGVGGAKGAVADAALVVDVDVEHGGDEAHLGRVRARARARARARVRVRARARARVRVRVRG